MIDHQDEYGVAAKKKHHGMSPYTEFFRKEKCSKKKGQANQTHTKNKLALNKGDNDTCNKTNTPKVWKKLQSNLFRPRNFYHSCRLLSP